MLKKLAYLLFIIAPVVQVYGGCPHCFRVARVKLIEKNGDERTGYIPVYYENISPENERRLSTGDDLKKVLSPLPAAVYFVEKYFSFKEIGNVVIKEDVEKISMEDIEKIIFIRWEKFWGAIHMPYLPREEMMKLRRKKILHVEKVSGQTVDYYLINLNPEIPEEEFKLFVKYSPIEIQDFLRVVYHLTRLSPRRRARKDTTIDMERLKGTIQKALSYIDEGIKELSIPWKNKYIGEYLDSIRHTFQKRREFYSALLSYIESKNTEPLETFINKEIKSDTIKKDIMREINETKEKGTGEVKIIRKIMQIFYKRLSLPDDSVFQKTMKESEIILLIRPWD
ncbi:hypothetical protein DRQ16_01480 [bacterium]|nr:MAG: hypothetical protein DRQ16_01480 [bacterium]